MPDLKDLNERQKNAAMHMEGPCMVIAAAGSGKTAMSIARIQHLIDQGVPAWRIVACTFTKKAAKEMEARLVKLVGEQGKQVKIGTIHAIAHHMLTRQLDLNQPDGWSIAKDSNWLIEMALEEPSDYNPHGVGLVMQANDAAIAISNAKADALIPEQTDDPVREVYNAYEAIKRDKKLLDFEDLLLTATRLLQNDSKFSAKWQNQWSYILVDEFQDTNMAQWLFLLELAKKKENLFVVGDDWQSIYGFRGARPQLMRTFLERFPDAKKVFLTTNYRSHDLIVDLGNRVIELNGDYQIKKKVEANRNVSDSAIVQIVQVKTDVEEARFVAQEIKRLHELEPDVPWDEYAVLYRTNMQSRWYEEALVEAEIPYHIVGDKHFYESRDVKVVLDYLRITQDTSDPALWSQLLNRPKRFISRNTIKEVEAGGWDVLIQRPECDGFVRTIRHLSGIQAPADAIRWLTETQKGLIKQQDENEPIRWMDTLIQSATRYRSIPEFLHYVDRIVENSKEPKGKTVQLLTAHRSKGLEYRTVFVVGVAEGLMPHKNSMEGEPLREETRLFYVALTRAKENLYLVAAKRYGSSEVDPSRYLMVLQEE